MAGLGLYDSNGLSRDKQGKALITVALSYWLLRLLLFLLFVRHMIAYHRELEMCKANSMHYVEDGCLILSSCIFRDNAG